MDSVGLYCMAPNFVISVIELMIITKIVFAKKFSHVYVCDVSMASNSPVKP